MLRWASTVLAVLLLIVWIGSGWWMAGVRIVEGCQVRLVAGLIVLDFYEPDEIGDIWAGGPSISFNRVERTPFHWWFERRDYRIGIRTTVMQILIPLWAVVIVVAAGTCVLWHVDRRRDPNSCRKCGYDRTGLPADRACPECGKQLA